MQNNYNPFKIYKDAAEDFKPSESLGTRVQKSRNLLENLFITVDLFVGNLFGTVAKMVKIASPANENNNKENNTKTN